MLGNSAIRLYGLIKRQLESDRQQPLAQLQHRDREIGRTLGITPGQRPNRKVMQRWLDAVSASEDSDPVNHRGLSWVTSLVIISGAVLGWLCASTLLNYDGRMPVNLIYFLLILVVWPGATLALWCILILIPRTTSESVLGAVSPGEWHRKLVTRLSGGIKPGNEFDTDLKISMQWQGYGLSHLFTLCFVLAACLYFLFAISFSDLAFGWNTTLEVSNDAVHSALSTMAVPWRQALPHASPTLELVDISRFYRLDHVLSRPADPDLKLAYQLGRWWPFLFMSLLVYSVLPRLVALFFSIWRTTSAVDSALEASSGANQIVARMVSPVVSTVPHETSQPPPEKTGQPFGLQKQLDGDTHCVVIEWAGAQVTAEQLRQIRVVPVIKSQAGGVHTLADDRKLLREMNVDTVQGIAIVVKAWEPPMLELNDFVASARKALSPRQSLILLISPLPGFGVRSEQMQAWENVLNTSGDSNLHIIALPHQD
ncbi:MAG: DUF2868 domain-containing protein [Pseudomonadota bacterium]